MDENLGAYYAQQPPPPPPAAGPGSNYPSSSSYYHPQPPPPGAPAPPPQTIHIPYIPQQPPTASYAAYVPSYVAPVAAIHDQVRTLFIAGLPEDVKPREIYNLFREFLGYESSHLRSSSQTTQPFAFATFVDQPSAIAAMQALNNKIKLEVARYYKEGMVFDLEKGSTLYIDLAKSNSRSKRLRTDDEWSSLDKKAKGSSTSARGPVDSGSGSVHLPGMANSACNTIGYPSAQSYRSYDGRAATESSAGKTSNSLSPPCPTLFVANLGPNCTEQELIQVFSGCRGFLKLKMQSTYGAPVAFVDFRDTACSTEALNHLQGTILYSSPAGEGMRLEYAKSRMGMRRKAK